jgi:hypothetical protein
VRGTLTTGLLIVCTAAASAGAPPGAPLVGAWNGAHLSMELTATGGKIEFDCAHGEIDGPLVPDDEGRFDLPGRYVEEHGGPVRGDAPDAAVAVRFTGRITNGRMKLTIIRGETNRRLGTFDLTRGGESTVLKCR